MSQTGTEFVKEVHRVAAAREKSRSLAPLRDLLPYLKPYRWRIAAAGTFTTSDAPDDRGFYRIAGITGTRNGAAITGLQPTGTAIPGNQPFAVDNVVSATGGQLTIHGFGYALANGAFANPFQNGAEYLEYLSVPPHPNGAGTELAVRFEAMIVP